MDLLLAPAVVVIAPILDNKTKTQTAKVEILRTQELIKEESQVISL